jgi:uncharacterized protein (DUF433 family)
MVIQPMNTVYDTQIIRDPQVNGGEPTLRGTRVPVRTILASLAEGAWIDEILADFPTIREAHIRAVIAFAAASAEEDLPLPALPDVA